MAKINVAGYRQGVTGGGEGGGVNDWQEASRLAVVLTHSGHILKTAVGRQLTIILVINRTKR